MASILGGFILTKSFFQPIQFPQSPESFRTKYQQNHLHYRSVGGGDVLLSPSVMSIGEVTLQFRDVVRLWGMQLKCLYLLKEVQVYYNRCGWTTTD